MLRFEKLSLVVLGLSLVGLGCAEAESPHLVLQPPPVNAPAPAPVPTTAPKAPAPTPTQPPHSIVVLPVPFTPQAPFANWAEPYQDACEEASMLMAAEFFKGNKTLELDPAYADQEIVKLVAWEKEHLGFFEDTTAAEVAGILKNYYHLSAKVVPYDAAAMRTALASRQLVLLPALGRRLGNPYYKAPGPLYHMLLVKGYQGSEFITNDPGTRRGESYRYEQSVLSQAVHDWNGGDVAQGAQVMIIVGKL